MHRKLAPNNVPGSKKLGLRRVQRPRPLKERGGPFSSLLKTRHGRFNGLLGRLRPNAESDCVVGVDECEAFSITLATQIERVTFITIDMNHLTRFKADPYASW
jgi:hypothetical protein